MRINESVKKRLRVIVAIALILITIAAFAYYISHHRDLITNLLHTPPITIVTLLILYGVWFVSLWVILWACLRIYDKKISIKEGFLINAYSVLFNFFIPGQGGIAVRGVYLKKIKNLSVLKYIYVTMIYFMFFAVVSTGLLLMFNHAWWETILAMTFITGFSFGVLYLYKWRSKSSTIKLDLTFKNIMYVFLATLFQSIVQVAIFAIELHSVSSHITVQQAVTYTGAANFSVFVALTPGAIGIRETFLVFTRHLSHLTVGNIVAASLIDRAVFLVFLGLLFIMTLSIHAKYKSVLSKPESAKTTTDVV